MLVVSLRVRGVGGFLGATGGVGLGKLRAKAFSVACLVAVITNSR